MGEESGHTADSPELNPEMSSLLSANVIKVSSGTAVSQVLMFLSALILARLFDPETFGISAIVFYTAMVLSVGSSLSYERAIIMTKSETDAAILFALCFVLLFINVSLLLPLIYFFQDAFVNFLNIQNDKEWVWAIPPLIVIGGAFQVLDSWDARVKKFGRQTNFRVAKNIFGALGQIVAGISGSVHAGGLILGRLFGHGIAVFCYGANVIAGEKLGLSDWRKGGRLLELVSRYKNFPFFTTVTSLLHTISLVIPVLLLGVFFSPFVVGLYALSNRIISVPMTLAGRSVANILYREAAELESDGRLGAMVDVVVPRLLVYAFIPFIFFFILGDLLALLIGDRWQEAGLYTQILSPFLLVWFVSSPLSQLVNVKERQGTGMVLQILILSSKVVPLIIGGTRGDARLAVILFSIGTFIAYGLHSWWLISVSDGSVVRALQASAAAFLLFTPVLVVLVGAKWWLDVEPLILLCLTVSLLCIQFVLVVLRDRRLYG